MLSWAVPGVPEAYQTAVKWGLAALAGLIVLRAVWRQIRRLQRSRRPPTLHPRLQRYGIDAQEAARRRELAARIVATSSGPGLAGYEIVEQIEAVFVDGFRSPAEAAEGLKAAAAERGANAIINVRQERSAAGRCTASGDAVRVRRME